MRELHVRGLDREELEAEWKRRTGKSLSHLDALITAKDAVAADQKVLKEMPLNAKEREKREEDHNKNLATATTSRTTVAADSPKLAADALACMQLEGACFVAGTPLLTPGGSKLIEQFRVGDAILSRSEFDPTGPIEAKVIEEVFVRTGRVAHLHAGGEVIGTTLEHPFFEADRGWVQANELHPGDRIATLTGEWVRVEEVYDTGEWAVVYNLRIADHHTYFVGNEEWGFAVWAHIAFCAQTAADGYITGLHSVLRNMQNVPANSEAHHIGQNAAMKTIPLTGSETYSPSTAPALFFTLHRPP